MLTVLLPVLLLIGPRPQVQDPDRFKASAVIKKFTGQNGFEELMVACERAADPRLDLLRSIALELASNPKAATDPEFAARCRRSGIPEGATLLEIREAVVGKHQDALNLIRKGMAKPVIDPRSSTMDLMTVLPDFSLLKSLTKVTLMAATIEFAYGRPRQGIDNLMLALLIGDSISRTAMIGQLLAAAIHQMTFAEIDKQQSGFGIDGWRRLEEWATQRSRSSEDLLTAVGAEFAVIDRTLRGQSGTEFIDFSFEIWGVNEKPEWIDKLSQSAAARLKDNVRRRCGERLQQWIDLIGGDEENWIKHATPTPETGDDDLSKVRSVSELEETLVNDWIPSLDAFIASVARMRTQYRLLALHAKIQRYRLHHDLHPQSLADVATEAERHDPHSDSSFVYELKENGYRLYSKGFRNTGEIELLYRRPRRQSGAENEPPVD